ncbi:hypothetical protein [Alicyclobacillus fodiniaquatilis]|jgi:hypothetical protein|uniref:N-acetyltransferase domain-containing protein n=1 Tax=Alicyclobacillus fodiniaquatilis TaxID=1661150 RepID=A0ABW4JKX0_9BACL
MLENQVQIRALREEDDYQVILNLLNQTIKVLHPNTQMSFNGHTPEYLKEQFCDSATGFVAERNGEIIAFMGVQLSEETHNASLMYGVTEPDVGILAELLAQCSALVRAKGGTKIILRSYLDFGQIRNQMITLWERLGFVADEYVYTSTNMDVRKWAAPDDLDLSGVEPVIPITEMKLKEIHTMLVEDGQASAASMFQSVYLQDEPIDRRDHVILSFKPDGAEHIAGAAYYKVVSGAQGCNALAFGIYFRVNRDVSRSEKRRFLQATLQSMKQLEIQRAVSRITFKDADVFAAMAAEGFYSITAQVHSINLTLWLN